ncbi:MAG: DUF2442 domain-containing protein [Candidatus Electrothrix sp. AR3]|nr:DUF2442 domain-containing protein [Candidatus Electrothrix sp. AR3]
MHLHIIAAQYVSDYKVKVTFNNGRKGIADLSPALKGPMFEQLKDKATFASLQVDDLLETITWPNGADLAPEYVFFRAFQDDPELQALFEKWGYINQSTTSQ